MEMALAATLPEQIGTAQNTWRHNCMRVSLSVAVRSHSSVRQIEFFSSAYLFQVAELHSNAYLIQVASHVHPV